MGQGKQCTMDHHEFQPSPTFTASKHPQAFFNHHLKCLNLPGAIIDHNLPLCGEGLQFEPWGVGHHWTYLVIQIPVWCRLGLDRQQGSGHGGPNGGGQ